MAHRAHPLALALVLAAACTGPAPDDMETVARFAGETVRYPEFAAYLERNIGEPGSSLPSEVLSELFDQFLDERLLVKLAVERGVAEPGADGRWAAMALLAADRRATEPTADEVAAYYEKHRERFQRPERVRLRQILVEDRSEAEAALAAIEGGAEFARVAAERSREPSAAFGGDQGELARGELPPVFADVIFALEPGQISGIVEADYGFHIFQVMEVIPAHEVSLDEAAPEIRGELAHQAKKRRLDELVREARNRYNPLVYERNLPFNYLGHYGTASP